jgi:hypothetical protein
VNMVMNLQEDLTGGLLRRAELNRVSYKLFSGRLWGPFVLFNGFQRHFPLGVMAAEM